MFDSTASNLAADPNGSVRDVFARDDRTGVISIVSSAPDGSAADGPSDTAVVAANGSLIVFTSRATNLVAGDSNGTRDVYARVGSEPARRISLTTDGGEANGPSYEPDVSADGRRVVFTSRADNLVPGDVNGVEDVFVHDLDTGRTTLVSGRDGKSPSGRSRAPAISPDGAWVSFETTAADLVDGDRNGSPDVVLADLSTGGLRLVSVSSAERQQNRAVASPFVAVSDVSEGGRFVVFDSDATNLVPRDRNKDTDVFVRDVMHGRTQLVSRSGTGAQGNNDSYFPTISGNGRRVAFTSFADNLWPEDQAGEDVFVFDRRTRASTPVTVTAMGRPRGREARAQLLRRPALSHAGLRVAFTSTTILVRADRAGEQDVFLRNAQPPSGRFVHAPTGTVPSRRLRYQVAVDDSAAQVFLCRLDGGRPFYCGASGRLPRLGRGRHTLSVRAGGPGMLFEQSAAVRRFRVR